MSDHLVINNYISRHHTIYGVYHTYHSNIVLFGAHELSELIFPGLFHELKTHCKYPEMFTGTVSAPSCYQLPDYISPTKLIQQLRTDLADALLFIHTWCQEHHNETVKQLLETNYDTYDQFFGTILMFIINSESTESIRDIAVDIKSSLRKLAFYLGPYHGNLQHCVANTQHVFQSMIFLILFMYLFSGISQTRPQIEGSFPCLKQDPLSTQTHHQNSPVLNKSLDAD